MKLLTNEHQESYENTKICYIFWEKYEDKNANTNKSCKVRDLCHCSGGRDSAHSMCNLKYSAPKKVPIVFYNGSNFIIKKLAEKFEGKFTCLGENTEKLLTFSVSIEKQVTRVYKKWKEFTKTISYKFIFLDREKFIASSLPNLVNNLVDVIHKIKCKYGHNDKKFTT